MAPSTDLRRATGTKRAAATRIAILGAAAACFGSEGYVGSSMDDIAAAAGVTKPTVYAHFGSKDGLFTALLQDCLAYLDELAPAPVATGAEIESALVDYASRRIDAMLDDTSLGLLRAASAEGIRRPDWAAALMDSLGTSEFEGWLEGLVAADLLAIDAPHEAAELFWAQLEGALFFPAVIGMTPVPTPEQRARVIAASVHLFLSAHAGAAAR